MEKVKRALLVFSFGFLCLPFLVQAQDSDVATGESQENFETSPSPDNSGGNFIIIADVNVYDAKIVNQDKNNFKLYFDIVNNGDVQPQVKYLVELLDSKNNIAHRQYYDEILNLDKNEKIAKTIDYSAPINFNGKYALNIRVANADGLLLSVNHFGEIELNGEGMVNLSECFIKIDSEEFPVNAGVDINSKTEKPIVRCNVVNDSKNDISAKFALKIKERSPFGIDINSSDLNKDIVLKSGESAVTDIELFLPEKPQSYSGEFFLVDASGNILSNSVPLHYVIQGESGNIINLSLDRKDYKRGEKANLVLLIAGDADNFPQSRKSDAKSDKNELFGDILITNDKNNRCAQIDNYKLISGINKLSADIVDDCSGAEIIVKLKNSDGKILDSNNYSLGERKQEGLAKNDNEELSVFKILFVCFAFLVLAVILVLIFGKSRRNLTKLIILFFGLGICFLGDAKSASAVTGYYTDQNGFAVTIMYSLDKTSLTTGESVTATLNVTHNACNNVNMNMLTGFKLDSGSWTSESTVINRDATHVWKDYQTGDKTKTFTNNTAGNHTIYFWVRDLAFYATDQDNKLGADGKYICTRCDYAATATGVGSSISNPTSTSCPCYERLFEKSDLSLAFTVNNPVPSMTSLSHTCNAAGTQATLSWSGQNASFYALRFNNGVNGWLNSCSIFNPGDFCQDLTTTSTTVNVTPGAENGWWVHAYNGGYSTALGETFACDPPAPDLTLTAAPISLILNPDSKYPVEQNTTLSWSIDNSAQACVGATGCTCTATGEWGGTKSTPSGSMFQPISSARPHAFTLTCVNNSFGTSTTKSVNVTASCNGGTWYDSSCDKNCGEAVKHCHSINTSCNVSDCTDLDCSLPECPVSSEWKEIKP